MENDDGGSIHGEYSPVEGFLHVGVRRVPPEEAPGVLNRLAADLVLAEFKDLPEHDDRILSAWLKMLNAKLDAILEMMDRGRKEYDSLPQKRVQISGGGIRVPFEGECAVEDVLEVKILLPTPPPVALCLYGKVMELSGNQASLSFLPMDEEIRDKVVHYVFLRQREHFRELRENRRSGD